MLKRYKNLYGLDTFNNGLRIILSVFIKALEQEYIFSKCSRNLKTSEIF